MFDFQGKTVWTQDVPSHETYFDMGTASSPVVYKDRVYIVNPGGYIGESTRGEIAYAKAQGKPLAVRDAA